MNEDDIDEVDYDLVDRLSKVSELNGISVFLKDPNVDFTLNKVVHIIAKPDIPAKVVTPLLNKLQGISFAFKVKAKFYMLIGKSQPDATVKKNLYMTLADETDKLVQALKYTTRNY